jgi:hypothetical protein
MKGCLRSFCSVKALVIVAKVGGKLLRLIKGTSTHVTAGMLSARTGPYSGS